MQSRQLECSSGFIGRVDNVHRTYCMNSPPSPQISCSIQVNYAVHGAFWRTWTLSLQGMVWIMFEQLTRPILPISLNGVGSNGTYCFELFLRKNHPQSLHLFISSCQLLEWCSALRRQNHRLRRRNSFRSATDFDISICMVASPQRLREKVAIETSTFRASSSHSWFSLRNGDGLASSMYVINERSCWLRI
jgi:hypothetical protein